MSFYTCTLNSQGGLRNLTLVGFSSSKIVRLARLLSLSVNYVLVVLVKVLSSCSGSKPSQSIYHHIEDNFMEESHKALWVIPPFSGKSELFGQWFAQQDLVGGNVGNITWNLESTGWDPHRIVYKDCLGQHIGPERFCRVSYCLKQYWIVMPYKHNDKLLRIKIITIRIL